MLDADQFVKHNIHVGAKFLRRLNSELQDIEHPADHPRIECCTSSVLAQMRFCGIIYEILEYRKHHWCVVLPARGTPCGFEHKRVQDRPIPCKRREGHSARCCVQERWPYRWPGTCCQALEGAAKGDSYQSQSQSMGKAK